MSSGSLESPNIDLYNPMAWSDVAVDFEMARSCHYTSGSGRTFAIHHAKYVEGCTSLDGLQFLGGDNSLGSGVDNIPTNYKETSFAKKNSLKDLDSSELFSLSLCSIPGHASSGSSWIRSMSSWWRTCTEFGCCRRPGRDGASLHFDFARNAEGCTSNSYVCHGINERGCTRNDRRNITKSSAQFIDNLDYQQHLCGVLRLFLSVQWWITWLIFVVRITVGVVSRLCFLDYDKSTPLDAGDLGWQSLRLATIGVMTFWIALRSGRVRHKRLVCVRSSRHQRPQKRANGLRLSVIGLCIIVANAHAIDVHQSICSRSPIPTDVVKATWVGSDDSVVDQAYDEFAYDTMIRELTVSEKRSPWDVTPEWPPDFDSSIEELDFSVKTLELRYERTCSNARSHVTDLWCIVCPNDYACTDEEGSISDLRTSVIALNPPMLMQSRLPDSGVTTRSSIDDAIWPLPETTFRRSFWNAAGLQVVAAPGRVWCEGRYYDFDDPLPMVAGTHFLVYEASTQSEDNSTYTDWSDDESNGEETEAADDDSSMLQINSDQYQTCVKCSEDLGSPPILQWRPNPQLQQPFDEVVPDVRTGPNGHEIVGTIQPPPNWASTPMFRAAAASGACRRGLRGTS